MASALSFPSSTLFSSCSKSQVHTALTRRINRLGRCLVNEPASTVGNPVCGNGIREGNEICDCGSPQVRATELLLLLILLLSLYYYQKRIYTVSIMCPYRSAQIAAAMPGLADWQPVLSAIEENAALTHASSRLLKPHVGVLVDSVMWQNTATVLLQTAQMIYTFKTALHVTITKSTASPESVSLIIDNVSTTLQPVSKQKKSL